MVERKTEGTKTCLIDTLGIAFNQSQALVRCIEEQAKTIDRLRVENEKLQQEVVELRANGRPQNAETLPLTEVDHLFKINAQKQAEIDLLMTRFGKEQLHQLRSPNLPHTLLAPKTSFRDTEVTITKRRKLDETTTEGLTVDSEKENKNQDPEFCQSRKRTRLCREDDQQPLREISNNCERSAGRREPWSSKSGSSLQKELRSIKTMIAEDGEDVGSDDNDSTKRLPNEKVSRNSQSLETHERLQALLSEPTLVGPVLAKSQVSWVGSSSSPSTPQGSPLNGGSSKGLDKPDKNSTPPLSLAKTFSAETPGIDNKYRSWPTGRSNLTHFKVNSKRNRGHRSGFNEILCNQDLEKCLPDCTKPDCYGKHAKNLALTLGGRVQASAARRVSDDELLLEFLGPGSEAKISTLTNISRVNLVHEARARQKANLYAKKHRNKHGRGQSPPGFWDAEMPGTQEGLEFRGMLV